ncbi:hypothetical protein ANCCEY_05030 [Ancylostoma ceylanicum]|uniref:Methyltransferase domain-containing protein n=1 Tax=Ancylostoma ceylanicum TaxID=53326 RepID=A0A0D6LUZ8_9BILA|nr:hypothetical protein ANCCEY_05030 [Ancylostoma ceylanicum]
MILDYNRNDMFLAGLRAVIQEKKAQAIPAHVLDIGTGTGLLSLMAAREGADKVTAVEVFQPMADCARSIIQSSQWKDKINVFDTELIGEGALRTFKEALDNLVQPGCRVVPSRGRVWVVPVESEFLAKFNRIPRLSKGDQPLGDCPGTAAVYDVQLSQVLPHKFTRLSEPILAFSFDFESSNSIIYDQSFDRRVTCTESGQIDAILMWWDLDMDGTGAFWIDMAPKWASKDYHVCEGRRVVVLGEGSLLFLLVAAVATSVTVVDSNPHFRDILERYISCYKLSNVKIVENTTDVSTDHDIVVGEPFYLSAMAPWQNLRFWYDVKSLRERLGSNVEVYPQTATLYGMCVRFDNLQNTAAPVGTVDGFDLSLFDDLSQAWITILKSGTNGIPLWMEWHIGNYTVTTGMKKEPRIGEAPEWKEGVRQGVYLLSPSLLQRETIRVDVRFSREEGEVKFQFY